MLLKAWLANRSVRIRVDWDPGVLDADVQLTAHGTVKPDGAYDLEPRSASLKGWWRDAVLLQSHRVTASLGLLTVMNGCSVESGFCFQGASCSENMDCRTSGGDSGLGYSQQGGFATQGGTL